MGAPAYTCVDQPGVSCPGILSLFGEPSNVRLIPKQQVCKGSAWIAQHAVLRKQVQGHGLISAGRQGH